MSDAITLGSLILPTDILLTLLNYVLFLIVGVFTGLCLFVIWHPYTRTSLLRMIGSRFKFLKWDWVMILLDYGGVIETIPYNKSNKNFAEINGGMYYFYQAYVKYVLGLPLYIFLANDARNVSTKYEYVFDEEGRILYDVYYNKKLVDKDHIVSVSKDEEGKYSAKIKLEDETEALGTVVLRTRPLAWAHYDRYHPELVSPKNLATGMNINRAENRILAALAIQQSKLLIQLILICSVITVVLTIVSFYTGMQQKPIFDAIYNNTEMIKAQTANLTVVYHA